MKASGLSVDTRHVLVVPIEVATAVKPALGARIRVGAHLKPPERNTQRLQTAACTRLVHHVHCNAKRLDFRQKEHASTFVQAKQEEHRRFVSPSSYHQLPEHQCQMFAATKC